MDYRELFYSKEVQALCRSMCELARECWDLKLSDSTGFSISARVPNTDAILVDKSGTGFRRNKIIPEDLFLYDINGSLLFLPEKSDNDRLAPVNTIVHLAGYKQSSELGGCLHWHDVHVNAFTAQNMSIPTFTLQSKLLGEIQCIRVDDRAEKEYFMQNNPEVIVPSGIHARPDVMWVMSKVGDKAAEIIASKSHELDRHGVVVTHYEHGLFAWGRSVEEAFENGYRVARNAESLLLSKLVS